MNDIGPLNQSGRIIALNIEEKKEPSGLNPTEMMLAATQEEADVKIDRSLIQPVSHDSPPVISNGYLKEISPQPAEVLSRDAQEFMKKVNSKFIFFDYYSKLSNALHYLHINLLELDSQSKSMRMDFIDQNMERIRFCVYSIAYHCLKSAMIKDQGFVGDLDVSTAILNKISKFKEEFADSRVENSLLERFQRFKDKEKRAKNMIDAFLLPLDEIASTFQYIQQLFNLPPNELISTNQQQSKYKDLSGFNKEFLSYKDCMINILKYGRSKTVSADEGACRLDLIGDYFDLSLKLVDLKTVGKENLNKGIIDLVHKKREIEEVIIGYGIDTDDINLNENIIYDHAVVERIMLNIEISVNILLLNKFHISEIDSIEMSLIYEELNKFRDEKFYERISSPIEEILNFKPTKSIASSLGGTTFPKMRSMFEQIIDLKLNLEADSPANILNILENFMDSDKTIAMWVAVKTIFEYFKKEMSALEKSMVECNLELQKVIDQTPFADLEEVEQMECLIKEVKKFISPLLFVFFKLPYTLDNYLIEGGDGAFKKPKLSAKKLEVDTQNNIKKLFNVKFVKAYQLFNKPEPQLIIEPIELPKIQEKVKVVAQPKKQISNSKTKEKAQIIPKERPIQEPKAFQTNRVDDILAELKERGWDVVRYHGSHAIFKRERETLTVPTSKDRLKDGTLAALNRQYAEKEVKTNNSQKKL